MIVAIHQPNYLPWLGYFAKIAAADVFVFLDDVQFSKGSYTNRVQIARDGKPAWLTVPAKKKLGDAINTILIAKSDWARSHLDTLKQCYRQADAFDEVWPTLDGLLQSTPGLLAETNKFLIQRISQHLNLKTVFKSSSELGVWSDKADERLALVVSKIAADGIYLSGSGGTKYQDTETFKAHGIKLRYSSFSPQPYSRSREEFMPGLSIIDTLCHLGWEGTAQLLDTSN